jgi:hypothetical protein
MLAIDEATRAIPRRFLLNEASLNTAFAPLILALRGPEFAVFAAF